jgi:hypothetical protein
MRFADTDRHQPFLKPAPFGEVLLYQRIAA